MARSIKPELNVLSVFFSSLKRNVQQCDDDEEEDEKEKEKEEEKRQRKRGRDDGK